MEADTFGGNTMSARGTAAGRGGARGPAVASTASACRSGRQIATDRVHVIPARGAGRPASGRGGNLLGPRPAMKVTFWGTRGSLAAAGPETVRYGGNTSCVEVRGEDGTLLVLDAG